MPTGDPMWVCPKCAKIHYVYASDSFPTPNYKCECGYDGMKATYCETDFYVPDKKETDIVDQQLKFPTRERDLLDQVGKLIAENKALETENIILREQTVSLTNTVMKMKEIMEDKGII